MRPALVLALLLLALPIASAGKLGDFESPHSGSPESGGVIPFGVSDDEAGKDYVVVFRNAPTAAGVFQLSVVADNGTAMFNKTGHRGLQGLAPLAPGSYRFVIQRSTGEFQVVPGSRAHLDATPIVEATLSGEADAYVLQAAGWRSVNVSGPVEVEVFDLLGAAPHAQAANETFLVEDKHILVLTVRGADGAAYSIRHEAASGPTAQADTPLPMGVALGALVAAGLVRRRS